MKKAFPVYNIKQFGKPEPAIDFYANRFVPHIKEHHFTAKPHKHDFYLLVFFTQGQGTHYIDFQAYPIKPGTVFMLSPGQVHSWKLSDDVDGYVFFHSKVFYDEEFTKEQIAHYPFFTSVRNQPFVTIQKPYHIHIERLFREIFTEYRQSKWMGLRKLHALVNILYIELSRMYIGGIPQPHEKYLQTVKQFETLIDSHFKEEKFPTTYASRLHITERHLNRITRVCLNKTPTALISDRIVLEAKRMLIHSNHSITEIAEYLGYYDCSYFSRLFKKKTKQSPRQFIESNR